MAYEKKQFSYFTWYCEDAKIFRKIWTNDQFARFFFAVMDYCETGEEKTVEDDIAAFYMMYCEKVNSARKKYESVCKKNEENGRKGGRQKAINQVATTEQNSDHDAQNASALKNGKAEETEQPAFKPSGASLKNLRDHLQQYSDIEFDNYEFDKFCADLQGTGWKFNGLSICSLSDLEELFAIWFDSNNNNFENRQKFEYTFKAFCSYASKIGYSLNSTICEDWPSFLGCKCENAIYSSQTIYGWSINGQCYSTSIKGIEEAIKAFYEDELATVSDR